MDNFKISPHVSVTNWTAAPPRFVADGWPLLALHKCSFDPEWSTFQGSSSEAMWLAGSGTTSPCFAIHPVVGPNLILVLDVRLPGLSGFDL